MIYHIYPLTFTPRGVTTLVRNSIYLVMKCSLSSQPNVAPSRLYPLPWITGGGTVLSGVCPVIPSILPRVPSSVSLYRGSNDMSFRNDRLTRHKWYEPPSAKFYGIIIPRNGFGSSRSEGPLDTTRREANQHLLPCDIRSGRKRRQMRRRYLHPIIAHLRREAIETVEVCVPRVPVESSWQALQHILIN